MRCVNFLEQNVCVPKIAEDEIVLPTPPTTVDSDESDEQTTEDRNVAENETGGKTVVTPNEFTPYLST